MKGYLLTSAALGIFAVTISLLPQQPPQERTRIGVILPFTGDLAVYATAFREGIELAQVEIGTNAAPTKPLELYFEDSQNNPRISNAATRKLVSVDKVDAMILSSYQDMMAGRDEYERRNLPALLLWDAAPEIDDAGHSIFSIGPWIPSAGTTAARFATTRLNGRTAAIAHNHSVWSEAVTKYFAQSFEAQGGKIVSIDGIDPDQTDFRSLVTKYKSMNPDILYSPLEYNLVSFYKQVRELGLASNVISSDIIAAEHISQAAGAFEGVYQTGVADPKSQLFLELRSKYETRYKKKLTLPWFVATGYDAMQLIFEGLKRRTADTPESLRDALYTIQNLNGVTRQFSISSGGSSPQEERMFVIAEGALIEAD